MLTVVASIFAIEIHNLDWDDDQLKEGDDIKLVEDGIFDDGTDRFYMNH